MGSKMLVADNIKKKNGGANANSDAASGLSFEGDLDLLLDEIRRLRGLDLDTYERSFLERRIQSELIDCGLSTYEDYTALLRKEPERIESLYDQLYINKTEFFRDVGLWQMLSNVVYPAMVERAAKSKTLRIWSAGCASGEEPFSAAMLLAEVLGAAMGDWRVEILASDVSGKAVRRAQGASYTKDALFGVPASLRKYLHSQGDDTYLVDERIRQWVWFQQGDLAHMIMPDRLDLVFCRNVMIYFTTEFQESLKIKLADRIKPGGYLIVGSAELVLDNLPKFLVQTSREHKVYQKIL